MIAASWDTRWVLSWRLPITLATAFCIEAVGEALARYGKPEIFNPTRVRSSPLLTVRLLLKKAQIAVSIGGKGAWRDSVFHRAAPEFDLHTYKTVPEVAVLCVLRRCAAMSSS